VTGRLTLGTAALSLREMIHGLAADAADAKPRIVLNLSGVVNMDSSGIGELVSGFTTVRSRGGVLKLTALPKRVEELLRMTGIYRVFEIHEDDARAIGSFQ
jgi:anti-sigma B factor antagonist